MKKMVRTLCLIWLGIFGCAGILLFTGCSWKQEKPEKTNLAFTVVDEARLPEELLKLVTEKKEASFKMTYACLLYTSESSPPCGNKGKTESSLGSMSGDKPRRLY